MTTTTMDQDLLTLTQNNLDTYFATHDASYVTEDALFINLATGEETQGREAVAQLLHYFYHVAFDAHAEPTNKIVTTDKAMIEGYFVGKHIGEFAGIAATGKTVKVPLCVSYEMDNGLIKVARVYMMVNVLIQQLTE